MSFDRVRTSWAGLSTLLASEMETIDDNLSKAGDFSAGGAYAPSSAIVVGGKGLLNSNAARLDCGLTGIPTKTFSAITQNRVDVINGFSVDDTLTLELAAASGDFVPFIAFFDILNEGVDLVIKDDGGTTVFSKRISRQLRRVIVWLERRGTFWSFVHMAGDNNERPDLTVIPTLPSGSTIHTVRNDEEFYDFAISDHKRIAFDPDESAGTIHRLHFKELLGGARISFFSGGFFDQYRVTGGGERNVIITVARVVFQSGGSTEHRIVGVEHARPPNNTLTASISTGIITVDTDEYARVKVNSFVGPGDDLTFDLSTEKGWSDGQEIVFIVNSLQSVSDDQTKIRWRQAGTSSIFREVIFGNEANGSAQFPSGLTVSEGSGTWNGFSLKTKLMFRAVYVDGSWAIGTML